MIPMLVKYSRIEIVGGVASSLNRFCQGGLSLLGIQVNPRHIVLRVSIEVLPCNQGTINPTRVVEEQRSR